MAEEDAQLNDIIALTRLCAQIILENGGETYRAEETVYRICRALGLGGSDVVALPTAVFITICRDGVTTGTAVRRIRKRTFNLQAVESVNEISRQLIKGKITVREALDRLDNLKELRPGNPLIPIIAAGMSSGCFALLFKGSVFDFTAAALCGMLVQFVAGCLKLDDLFNFAISILGGILIGIGSVAAVRIAGIGHLERIITGAMMPLLPGIAMTNAIRDAMRGDLMSGVTRAAEALLMVVALAFGVGVVLKIYYIFA